MNQKLIVAILSIVIEGALAAIKLIGERRSGKGRKNLHDRHKSGKRRNLTRL